MNKCRTCYLLSFSIALCPVFWHRVKLICVLGTRTQLLMLLQQALYQLLKFTTLPWVVPSLWINILKKKSYAPMYIACDIFIYSSIIALLVSSNKLIFLLRFWGIHQRKLSGPELSVLLFKIINRYLNYEGFIHILAFTWLCFKTAFFLDVFRFYESYLTCYFRYLQRFLTIFCF